MPRSHKTSGHGSDAGVSGGVRDETAVRLRTLSERVSPDMPKFGRTDPGSARGSLAERLSNLRLFRRGPLRGVGGLWTADWLPLDTNLKAAFWRFFNQLS